MLCDYVKVRVRVRVKIRICVWLGLEFGLGLDFLLSNLSLELKSQFPYLGNGNNRGAVGSKSTGDAVRVFSMRCAGCMACHSIF